MSYSLGLTLYNLAARPGPFAPPQRPARPAGALVWLHAAGEEVLAAMQELARHLIEDDGVQVVLTCTVPSHLPTDAIHQPPPPDFPPDVQDFLDHWRPEIAVFSDGELHPAMVYECSQRHLPVLMVAGRAPHLIHDRDGWYPGLIKSTLHGFRHLMVLDDAAARIFRKLGAEPGQIEVTGRMEEASAALPYVERDREALAEVMATRPTWLAADVTADELADVITAHRQSLQLAHRLLLILVPQDPDLAPDIAARLEAEEGWRVALRRRDQDPDGETEVYIPDASEYGLWYRLAPVTFLGGSLHGDGCARSPMEPAALGSAILYGPNPGIYGPVCGRLGAARAARMVASGRDLAEALGDLLSPDRAARQARAAWIIASEGTEATDRAMSLIRNLMDGTA
ncbi:MAG: glycosyltransferase N-terminal domain-containing protein [bacterium]